MPGSDEVVLSDDGGEVVLWFTLDGGSHALELLKADWIVNALLEEVKFRLTHSQEAIHLEEAFSCVVERVKADWFEGETIHAFD